MQALRGQWTVFDAAHKRERNLALIAYPQTSEVCKTSEVLSVNRFHFTQEMTFVDRDRRRMDMMLWVNGLPVCVVENKSPTVAEAELEAFDQIQRVYTDRIPESIKYPPLFAVANAHLHYGATWNDDAKAMNVWKADGADYGLERLGKSFFDRQNMLDMLKDYVLFYRAEDQTHKFVLRPHQMRATRKIVERVLLPSPVVLDGGGARGGGVRSGLEWHTQGSGKTLTMIVAAHQLRREMSAKGENPTLLIVVDRRELEGQMKQNLEAFGFPAVERARNKQHLYELLAGDYRGLIVTLIHKFDRMPKNMSKRRNIVVQIDEAHRSQEGDLATYMWAALPNAFYFGYTSTPVDKAGVASIEALNKLLDKADKLKAVMKAPDRVRQIAEHVARHFKTNVEPLEFKAFVVAVDREACALYKQALGEFLPHEYSQAV